MKIFEKPTERVRAKDYIYDALIKVIALSGVIIVSALAVVFFISTTIAIIYISYLVFSGRF